MPLNTYNRKRQSDRLCKYRTIGEIHKGSPKKTNKDGKEIQGEDLDHFRFTAKGTPEEQEQIMAAWVAAYGEKPTTINFYTLADTPDQAVDAWYWEFKKINKADSRGKAFVKCNGDEIVGWSHPQTKEWISDRPKPCRRQEDEEHCSLCKPSAKLELMIPELWQAGFQGYVLFHISSFDYDYPEIVSNLEAIAQTQMVFNKTLAFTPLQLCRAERIVSTSFPSKDGKERISKLAPKSLCYITQPKEYVQKQIAGVSDRQSLALLPPAEVQQAQLMPAQEPVKLAWRSAPEVEEETKEQKAERIFQKFVERCQACGNLVEYNAILDRIEEPSISNLLDYLSDRDRRVKEQLDALHKRMKPLLTPQTIEAEAIAI